MTFHNTARTRFLIESALQGLDNDANDMSVLDTPQRITLSDQSTQLRTDLKIFERDFFAANSRKPGKEDIKQNQTIAQKYKEYNKIRDVLSGKLSTAALAASSPTRDRKRKRSKHDDEQQESRRSTRDKRAAHTPRKEFRTLQPHEIDPYDAPPSASPRPHITEIGPTPQRDGKVMGIFDLLEVSTSKKGTPSKKHLSLFDEEQIMHSPSTNWNAATSPSKTRTPAKRRQTDILDHLTGTPMTGHNRMRARTPASSAKKFMLNQFFATPSAIRYATMLHSTDADGEPSSGPEKKTIDDAKTPLRDRVLGVTPSKPTVSEDNAGDQTPAYLKRSFSFKQRLLSALTGTSRRNSLEGTQEITRPENQIQRIAPSQRRKGRYNPRTLSQIAQEIKEREAEERRTVETSRAPDEDGASDADDDEWEALREIEVNDNLEHIFDEDTLLVDSNAQQPTEEQPARKWKKKGQKRSTRRVIMRPSKVGLSDPKYRKQLDESDPEVHGAEDSSENEDDKVEATQSVGPPAAGLDVEMFSDDELFAQAFGSESSDAEFGARSPVKKKAATKGGNVTTKAKAKSKKLEDDDDLPARKINPNLQSHMNFRTLKIKNKNGKAKRGAGGRGKFGGRGRR